MAESGLIVREVEGVRLVRFRDNSILDALAIQRIARELHTLVEDRNISAIVLDFSEVRFLSSEALRMLLGLRAKSDRSGNRVALCCIRPELQRIFKLTNLDKLFSFFDSVETAQAALAS